MMPNCWEVKECNKGRNNTESLGVCPAVIETRLNGQNRGRNGGRSCWVVTGTLCGDAVQGTFASKIVACGECDFFRQVAREERPSAASTTDLLKLVR